MKKTTTPTLVELEEQLARTDMAQRKLDTREARFIEEYLVDLDPK